MVKSFSQKFPEECDSGGSVGPYVSGQQELRKNEVGKKEFKIIKKLKRPNNFAG